MKQTTFGELKPGDRFRVNHMNWVKLEEDIGEKVWHPDKMRYIKSNARNTNDSTNCEWFADDKKVKKLG